ncbi:HIT domain-containing protein [Candidatus Woesearchaeota archaeon]|nr:HIT domain-containing protein [Candidatus Woesearchaeota archaeon]
MNPENMTPEQMAAMAKQQCVFCQIASGKVASRKIYEDDKVIGVLDINPANPGHVLLITKEHYVVMPQIPDDVVAHVGMVAKGISHALLRTLQAQGTTIFAANGVAAGQRAQHFMLHVIPRMENDGIGIEPPEHEISDSDYKKILQALKPGIAKAFGKEAEKEPEKEEGEEATEEEPKKEEPEKAEVTEGDEPEEEEKTAEAEEVPEEEPEEPEEEEIEKAEDEVTEKEEETGAEIVEAEEVPEEEPEAKEPEEEEPEEEEPATLEEAAKGKKTKKKKKAKKKTKKKKQEPKEEEPEDEIDEERQKLDQIAGLMTGQ